jgi:hypothetical protein
VSGGDSVREPLLPANFVQRCMASGIIIIITGTKLDNNNNNNSEHAKQKSKQKRRILSCPILVNVAGCKKRKRKERKKGREK